MMGDDLRCRFRLILELLRKDVSDVRMDALPPAAQQRGVGSLLNERVLEDIDQPCGTAWR